MAGNLCFKGCGARGDCGAHQVCSRRLNGGFDLVKTACIPGNDHAFDGSPCTTFGDCTENQFCSTNPFTTPGGMCVTIGCTPQNDATCAPGGDGICFGMGTTSLCLDGCSVANDCRTADHYSCVDPGNGKKVCVVVHADPGAACGTDADCGPAGTPWRCLMTAKFPNGYCSGAPGSCAPGGGADQCPDKAQCFDPTPAQPGNGDEFCAKNCNVAGDCRTGEGYQCVPADPNMAAGGHVCVVP
jgi:hypothetical protein